MCERNRILIADDHALFRCGIPALLTSLPAFDVLEQAAMSEEAISRTADVQSGVVVMVIPRPGAIMSSLGAASLRATCACA